MSVLLETSKGDIVIDLFVEDCPVTTKNFLKLCKIKYYNNCLFHNVQRNFIAQTGDPSGTGKGGTSIYGKMYGDQARFFDDELRPQLKHTKRGVVGMASGGKGLNASQFYITLVGELDSLDEKHTVFGQVAEGLDVLDKLNESFCDEEGLPFQNIRIRHTVVLDDPFDDAPEMLDLVPESSPEPEFGQGDRLEDDWAPTEDGRSLDEIEEELRKSEARNRAVVLEMVGDLPDADSKPPPNMLFMCKLNPVTSEEDLEIIFSRFGTVTSCDIIRDMKTGDSLCYGFVAFDTDEACEAAYFKMNNVLIDDRRIKVDFSQSVHNLWAQFKTGGRKGSADMRKAADQHERGASDASNGGGGGGRGGRPSGREGAGGRGGHHHHHHQLILDEPEQQQQQGSHKRMRHPEDKQLDAGRPHSHHSSKHKDTEDHKSRGWGSDRHEGSKDRSHRSNHHQTDRNAGGGGGDVTNVSGGGGRGQHGVEHNTKPNPSDRDVRGSKHTSQRSEVDQHARERDAGSDPRHTSGSLQDDLSGSSRHGREQDGSRSQHKYERVDSRDKRDSSRQRQDEIRRVEDRSSKDDSKQHRHHHSSRTEPSSGKDRHQDTEHSEPRERNRDEPGERGEHRHKSSKREGGVDEQDRSRKTDSEEHGRSSKGGASVLEEATHTRKHSRGDGGRQREEGARRGASRHHQD